MEFEKIKSAAKGYEETLLKFRVRAVKKKVTSTASPKKCAL